MEYTVYIYIFMYTSLYIYIRFSQFVQFFVHVLHEWLWLKWDSWLSTLHPPHREKAPKFRILE